MNKFITLSTLVFMAGCTTPLKDQRNTAQFNMGTPQSKGASRVLLCDVINANGTPVKYQLSLNQPGSMSGSVKNIFKTVNANLNMDAYCDADFMSEEAGVTNYEGQLINSNAGCKFTLDEKNAGVYTETVYSISIGHDPVVTSLKFSCKPN